MAPLNKFNSFTEDITEKVHNLGADTLKVFLTATAPVATNTIKDNIGELAPGVGYTGGGTQATTTSSAQTSGTYKLVLGDVVFTATGTMGPFRYVVLYNSTPTSPKEPLIGWYDYTSSVTLANGESFTTDFDAVNGVLTLA